MISMPATTINPPFAHLVYKYRLQKNINSLSETTRDGSLLPKELDEHTASDSQQAVLVTKTIALSGLSGFKAGRSSRRCRLTLRD